MTKVFILFACLTLTEAVKLHVDRTKDAEKDATAAQVAAAVASMKQTFKEVHNPPAGYELKDSIFMEPFAMDEKWNQPISELFHLTEEDLDLRQTKEGAKSPFPKLPDPRYFGPGWKYRPPERAKTAVKLEDRNFRTLLTCQCPVFFLNWVNSGKVVSYSGHSEKGDTVAEHVQKCKEAGLEKDWHALDLDDVKAMKPGTHHKIDSLIRDNQYYPIKMVKAIGVAKRSFLKSGDGPRLYDNLMQKYFFPSMMGPVGQLAIVTSMEADGIQPLAGR